MKKRLIAAALSLIVLGMLFAGCTPGTETSIIDSIPQTDTPLSEPALIKGKIILGTTTSTADSGLLEFILPFFTAETGWEVDVISVGTGAAMQMGRDGDADVLLVHSRPDEDKFVEEGYGTARYDVMYNDYIILGPKDGPIVYNNDIRETFMTIAQSGLDFVSRGDDSGTHKKELEIWSLVEIDPENNSAYVSAGQGMGATIGMAKELSAYALSDRATWLNYADKGDLEIVSEGSEELFNPYGVIPVSARDDRINAEGGQAFADWITGSTAQALIATFGVEEFGKPLFFPDAK
ncbi:MAG: substrate-binding domain-containing protein [Clostridiales bacterium]|nr:substrate-binding domain-containing protein [Clostridiales bacterium]